MTTALGSYVLDAILGSGATGTVWRAHRQGQIPQVVAIKRLRGGDPGDVDRLRREANVLAGLDHPHIVRVLEVIEDGGDVALVLQYAPGGSLELLLAERTRLEPGEVVAVAAPMAGALASAHRRGIVHGDVKPANVLFTSDGEPLLGDFGVARALGKHMTLEHAVAGTAEYLAPELLDGAMPDARSDVYCLGVVCYQALTGALPFTGHTPLAVVRAADLGSHVPLTSYPDVPPPLAAVVESAIARDPAARPQTADEFGGALRGSLPPVLVRLPGLPTTVPQPTASPGTRTFGPRPPRPASPEARRANRGFRFAALGVALIVAAAGVYVWSKGGGSEGRCTWAPAPKAIANAQYVEGDTSGEGCRNIGVYYDDNGTMILDIKVKPDSPDARYAFGRPGDVLFLGDWNCDSVATPALYRSSTGETFYYDAWAEQGAESNPRKTQGPANGTAELAKNAAGCDEVSVRGDA